MNSGESVKRLPPLPRGLTTTEVNAIRRLLSAEHRATAVKVFRGATGGSQQEAEQFLLVVESGGWSAERSAP
ncbi:MAG TPA: hypothetical protein VIK18_21355 [Pirellulales bacterium]